MANDKKHDDLTVFGKETDNSKKMSQHIEERAGDGGPDEAEMDQQIQDEEIKSEQ